MGKQMLRLSRKGMALLLAVESGLCPEVEGGYDTDAFEVFWGKYQDYLVAEYEKEGRNLLKMFKRHG